MDKVRKGRRHSVPHVQLHEEAVINESTSASLYKLAVIAPRNDKDQGLLVHSPVRSKATSPTDGSFKERLPPRSRNGCWTCRTRKVKCDEEHPKCGQCVRLQHQCDYSPRLSFRDDTRRIIERMQEVSIEGSVVWDQSARSRRGSLLEPEADANLFEALPPFSELTNDDDRELKALTRLPGTYHLVVNQSSFQDLEEEEREDEEENHGVSQGSSGRSVLLPTSDTIKREDSISPLKQVPSASKSKLVGNLVFASSNHTTSDPDVVILRRFEEPTVKMPPLTSSTSNIAARRASIVSMPSIDKIVRSRPSPVTEKAVAISMQDTFIEHSAIPQREIILPLSLPHLFTTPNDEVYLQYYREVVAPSLFQVRGVGNIWDNITQNGDFFELEAAQYPPLFHAIMALSAFSLGQRSGDTSSDVSHHYQLVLPALQATLSSPVEHTIDGVLYTHFFMLLYEIVVAEPGRPNLWQQHLSQLRSYLFERVLLSTTGATQFIIWYLVVIDVVASLAGVDDGDITDSFLKGNLVTDFQKAFVPDSSGGGLSIFSSIRYRHLENAAFVQVLSLNQQLILSGLTMAKTSNVMRTSEVLSGDLVVEYSTVDPEVQTNIRHSQVARMIEDLRSTWLIHTNEIDSLSSELDTTLSVRIKMLLSQATMLYHALNIYVRTSMWRGQREATKTDEGYTTEIAASIYAIFAESNLILSQRDTFITTGFMLFPLFLAGVNSSNASDKAWVLDTLSIVETSTIGRNCVVTKEALQVIYQRQVPAFGTEAFETSHICWQDTLSELGIQVALFGF